MADSRDEKKKSRGGGGESCEICMYMERVPSRVSSRVPSRWLLPVLHMGNAVGKEEREGGRLTHFSLRAFKTVVRYLVFISEKERERERRSARK